MTEPLSRLERLLERAAGLGLNTTLHPATLLQQVQDAATGSVSAGAIANVYTIALSPGDLRALGPNLEELRGAIIPVLDEVAAPRRLSRAGPWAVEFEAERGVTPGQSRVRAFFRNQGSSDSSALPGKTERITRLRNAVLNVGGVGTVRLTHTPFTIGRSPECDLMIPDLEVSRRHARIESTSEGLVIRDLGSRNQIVILGEQVEFAPLVAGTAVLLGSTEITLEFEA
jgi:hypothetical protein